MNLRFIKKEKTFFDIKRLTGFLNHEIMNLHDRYENTVFLEDGYEGVVQSAEDFYQLTYQRDKKFIENMTAALSSPKSLIGDHAKAGASVLITGGYHTPNLKYLLKQKKHLLHLPHPANLPGNRPRPL